MVMRQLMVVILLCIQLLQVGCEQAYQAAEVQETLTLSWQGFLASPPANPLQYWVYFDVLSLRTMIYTGEEWEVMSTSGDNATGLDWRGSLEYYPDDPEVNTAFYHLLDNATYLYNGTGWSTISSSGEVAKGVQWIGVFTEDPANPEENFAYYNSSTKTSYIYNGSEWSEYTVDGLNGLAMRWLGSFPEEPKDVELLDAYHNSVTEASYIYTESGWQLISHDGITGENGDVLHWQGVLTKAPDNPKENWVYEDSATGAGYIFRDTVWEIFTTPGRDGIMVQWLGTFPIPPIPMINGVYKNEDNGNCYIFNGVEWDLFSVAGEDGEDGLDGRTIDWRGTYNTHPLNPEEYWAYFNPADAVSYIYDHGVWEVLVPAGKGGTAIRWLGEFSSAPINPQELDAYYNISNGQAYYYDGGWHPMTREGTNGFSGRSYVWKGNGTTFPENPINYWMFFRTDLNELYLYNSGWTKMASGGTDGVNGERQSMQSHQWVNHGDTILLQHDMGTLDVALVGQYVRADSMRYFAEQSDPSWIPAYEVFMDSELRVTNSTSEERCMTSFTGGTVHYFADPGNGSSSVVFRSLLGETIDSGIVGTGGEYDLTALHVMTGWSLLTAMQPDSSLIIRSVTEPSAVSSRTVLEQEALSYRIVEDNVGDIALLFVTRDNNLILRRFYKSAFNPLGSGSADSDPLKIKVNALFIDSAVTVAEKAQFDILPKSNGDFLIVYSTATGTKSCVVNGADNTVSTYNSIEGFTYRDWQHDLIEIGGTAFGIIEDVYSSYHVAYIARYSEQGELEKQDLVTSFHNSISLFKAEDNSIGIIYSLPSDGNAYGGYVEDVTYVKSCDPEFVVRSETQFLPAMLDMNVTTSSNGDIVVEYEHSEQVGSIHVSTLVVSDEKPRIEVRRLNENRACLINYSGRRLDATLTVMR